MVIKNKNDFTENVIKVIQSEIQRWKTERILLVFLDKHGDIIYKKIISVGYSKYKAYFYPDDVNDLFDSIKPEAVIWAHNHVNDYPTPSEQDDEVHYWFTTECKKRSIIPYDSIIVMRNNNSYYSYKEHDRLDVIPSKLNVASKKEEYYV